MRVRSDVKQYKYDIAKKLLPKQVFDSLANKYVEGKWMKWDDAMCKEVDDVMRTQDTSQPCWVEVETINRCNGKCNFCPVNRDSDPRPYMLMTDELFQKIIGELHDMQYKGRFALFCNGEPLMDKKIFERVDYAKRMLPYAYHYLYTNGSLLTPEKLDKLAGTLDMLIIDNYAEEGYADDEMTPPIRKVYDQCKDKYDNVVVWMRRNDEVFNTRGGEAPNRKKIPRALKSGCVLPFQHMYIRPDGKVGLCCQDAVWHHPPLGDLSKQTVMEVWNGSAYTNLRKMFLEGGARGKIPVCRDCDFVVCGKTFI